MPTLIAKPVSNFFQEELKAKVDRNKFASFQDQVEKDAPAKAGTDAWKDAVQGSDTTMLH